MNGRKAVKAKRKGAERKGPAEGSMAGGVHQGCRGREVGIPDSILDSGITASWGDIETVLLEDKFSRGVGECGEDGSGADSSCGCSGRADEKEDETDRGVSADRRFGDLRFEAGEAGDEEGDGFRPGGFEEAIRDDSEIPRDIIPCPGQADLD